MVEGRPFQEEDRRPPPRRPDLITARGLCKRFRNGGTEVDVLQGLDMDLQSGETLAIIGASGIGKSTLLHILGTLDRPDSGSLHFNRESLLDYPEDRLAKFRNECIGFVFQFHHLLAEFTALENACMPALVQRREPTSVKADATTLLTEVGLGHRLHHKPGELSGGEQQRVAMARALMQNPDLVLADEPTGNLDTHSGEGLFRLMRTLNKTRGTTFVIVTHKDKLSAQSDRIIHMQDGQIA